MRFVHSTQVNSWSRFVSDSAKSLGIFPAHACTNRRERAPLPDKIRTLLAALIVVGAAAGCSQGPPRTVELRVDGAYLEDCRAALDWLEDVAGGPVLEQVDRGADIVVIARPVEGFDGQYWPEGDNGHARIYLSPTSEGHPDVCAHELGHALGLDHNDERGTVMWDRGVGRSGWLAAEVEYLQGLAAGRTAPPGSVHAVAHE